MVDSSEGDEIQRILNAKQSLNEDIKRFGQLYQKCEQQSECILNLITSLISNHSTLLNEVNSCIGTAHRKHDFFIDSNLKQDYLGTLENFIPVSLKLVDVIRTIITKNNLTELRINEHAYLPIQRFLNTFSTFKRIQHFKFEFENRNISIDGFKQKYKRMKDRALRVQLWIGVPMLILTIGLIFSGEYFLNDSFTGLQLILGKVLIALSVSKVGSSLIEGNVETKWSLQKGISIRAIGWVAVFLLLFFLNPASPGDVY